MLIIYDRVTKLIVGWAGYYTPLTKDADIESILPAEPLPENQSYFHIYEEAKIAEIWGTYNTGGTLELVFDKEGNPVDVKCTIPE